MASLVEMRPRCNIINQTPCCPSPILTTSKLLGQGFEAAWSGARGGVNLALEQLEEDLAGRSLITARYRWSRLTPWFYAWQLLARPCGLSFPGLKSCSAQRLSLFKLCGHSSRAGWRDWSTACRDVTALIYQVWQFRVPLLYHEDHALLPFMWLKELFMMLKYFLLSNRVLWLNLPTRAPTQLRLSEYTVIITIWWMWFFLDIKIALSRPAHPGNVQQQFNIEQ